MAVVREEDVKIHADVSLWRKLCDAETIAFRDLFVDGNFIEGSQTRWSGLLVAVHQLVAEIRFIDPLGCLIQPSRTWLTDTRTVGIARCQVIRVVVATNERNVKMDRWIDEVDVFLDVFWNTVLIAYNMRHPGILMFPDVILGLEETPGILSRGIEVEPGAALRLPDAARRDTSGMEPVPDRRHSFIARSCSV